MEELFQLIVGLFIVLLPIFTLLGRRRRTAWERAQQSDAEAGAATPVGHGGWTEPAQGGAGQGVAGRGAQSRRAERWDASRQGAEPWDAKVAEEGRWDSSVPPTSGIGSSATGARRKRQGSGIGEQALARIEGLPRMQKAFVWSEVFGRPKALRRTPDPWDE